MSWLAQIMVPDLCLLSSSQNLSSNFIEYLILSLIRVGNPPFHQRKANQTKLLIEVETLNTTALLIQMILMLESSQDKFLVRLGVCQHSLTRE